MNVKCNHSKCKFNPRELENLKDEIFDELNNYLSLEESEAYVTDIITAQLARFKEEADKEAENNYHRLDENMLDTNTKTRAKLEEDIKNLDA